MTATLTVNGTKVGIRREWMCACPGDHPANQPNAKCFRKGGYDVNVLFDLHTDAEVGMAFEDGPMVREFIDRWGWTDTGILTEVDGTDGRYLLHPGVTL